MYSILRALLFQFDPEKIHYFVTGSIRRFFRFSLIKRLAEKSYAVHAPALEREVFGLKFKNPVGLAAGFDKNAQFVEEFAALGFGFIEVGTVTPLPQPGNEKPRMFRLPADEGLINRMGFNNEGIEGAIERLKNRPKDLIIGGNIGKNKNTPNEEAINDYEKCFEALYPYVDYFVVNVTDEKSAGAKELLECRGKVISDYQQYLENHWVDELKKEFIININKEVFSKVKNQLNN